MQLNLFFYDLETTHLDWYKGGIHQLSGILEVGGKIVERFNFHLAPFIQDEIDPKSLEIGKVTEKQIRAYQNPREVFVQLLYLLMKHKGEGLWHMVGYNNRSFDDHFLRRFFAKNDYYLTDYFYNHGIDVLANICWIFADERDLMRSLSLKNVSKYFGVSPTGDAHNASVDVDLTYKLYKKIQGETI